MSENESEKLNTAKLISYFWHNLKMLPSPYETQDVNRVVLAFFCVQGLALLKALDRIDKEKIIEWIYALQIHPDCRDPGLNDRDCGFRGGTWNGNEYNQPPDEYSSTMYDTSSIATTFASLSILKTLGDDLTRVNKIAITKSLKYLQNEETGSFSCVRFGSEEDMRFVYCACAISFILDDWSGVDKDGVVRYVRSCQSFDGGLGISPGLEAQGGATFCGIAALSLCKRLNDINDIKEDLIHWLINRQVSGFQGRCNKIPDSCYAFWNGGALNILGMWNLINKPKCREFLLSCEFRNGGIAKYPDSYPDVMHSYYSLAWFSMADDDDIKSLNTKLQIPFY